MELPKNVKISDRLLTNEEVHAWMSEVRKTAHAPSSDYLVCGVVRAQADDGTNYYFAGVNAENHSERLSMHGEEAALSAAFTALGPVEISEVWTLGAPKDTEPDSNDPLAATFCECCGKCRQQLTVAPNDTPVHNFTLNGEVKSTTVGNQLPDSFGYRNFLPDAVKKMAKPEKLSQEQIQARLIRPAKGVTLEIIEEWLEQLQAANFNREANKAMIIQRGDMLYAGVEVQDAAYIGISPAQTTVAGSQVSLGKDKISKVWANYTLSGDEWQVLAEHSNPKIQVMEFDGKEWANSQVASLAIPKLPSYAAQNLDRLQPLPSK